MSDLEARAITKAVAKAHPKFRHIETRCHDRGASIAFAPIELDPRTISGWFDAEGATVLMIGREWITNGFVMYVELRA